MCQLMALLGDKSNSGPGLSPPVPLQKNITDHVSWKQLKFISGKDKVWRLTGAALSHSQDSSLFAVSKTLSSQAKVEGPQGRGEFSLESLSLGFQYIHEGSISSW